MTWTYSGDPSASPLDEARFLVGDTDTVDQLTSNEEINYFLKLKGNAHAAAPHIAAAIMSKMSRQVDYWIGHEKVYASQRLAAYKTLVDTLRSLWINSNAAPSWGTYKPVTTANGSAPALFDVGMHDNGGGGRGLDG